MHGALRIDPSDAVPIWRQIEEGMARLVASGALRPGEPVPSVRDLARDLRVNPATVAKAYQRLVEAGVLVARRGDGTYVAESPPLMDEALRARVLAAAADRYAVVAATVSVAAGEALAAVRAALARLSGKPGEGS